MKNITKRGSPNQVLVEILQEVEQAVLQGYRISKEGWPTILGFMGQLVTISLNMEEDGDKAVTQTTEPEVTEIEDPVVLEVATTVEVHVDESELENDAVVLTDDTEQGDEPPVGLRNTIESAKTYKELKKIAAANEELDLESLGKVYNPTAVKKALLAQLDEQGE